MELMQAVEHYATAMKLADNCGAEQHNAKIDEIVKELSNA